MDITHVIRGDDHVNNTPRQINIFKALGATLPLFAHVPMILGADGERLSKRHGAVSVMQYDDDGYLPEALVNYLARLGWSHGDEEMFSREQFVEWFDLEHVSQSPAQFDPEKLNWLNQQYLKAGRRRAPGRAGAPRLEARGVKRRAMAGRWSQRVALFKDRVATTSSELADAAEAVLSSSCSPRRTVLDEHLRPSVLPALRELRERFADVAWERAALAAAIKETAGRAQPQDAAARDAVARAGDRAQTQTPSIDAVLELLGRETVLARMEAQLQIIWHAGFTSRGRIAIMRALSVGGIAQLGERLHGMQEVSGSIPLTSTNKSSIHKSTVPIV